MSFDRRASSKPPDRIWRMSLFFADSVQNSLRFPSGALPGAGASRDAGDPGQQRGVWLGVTHTIGSFASQHGRHARVDGCIQETQHPIHSVRDVQTAQTFLDDSTFDRKADGRAGVDVKMVPRDAVTLDFTINPDFSQVESDEPQVTVNQRFEVFFPEKRPFFLENSDYFNSPLTLFFSRRVRDPQFGARMTGKIGSGGPRRAGDRRPCAWPGGDALDPSSRIGPSTGRPGLTRTLANSSVGALSPVMTSGRRPIASFRPTIAIEEEF